MKVLALLFVLGLVSCTPKEAPVATDAPAATETQVEEVTTEESTTEAPATEAPAAE